MICRWLLAHADRWEAWRARRVAGISNARRSAMSPMTTMSSTSVNAAQNLPNVRLAQGEGGENVGLSCTNTPTKELVRLDELKILRQFFGTGKIRILARPQTARFQAGWIQPLCPTDFVAIPFIPVPKRIAILGSTGSIGCNALQVIEHLGGDYKVSALSAHSQGDRLLEQVRKYRPATVAITDDATAQRVRGQIEHLGVNVYQGQSGLAEMVRRDDVDIVLAAIVGAAGLGAVVAAVKSGKRLALANKEALVVAGSLVVPLAKKNNVPIIPVDSEHSAVFQAMSAGKLSEVKRVILTASGGPFRNKSKEQMHQATPEDAVSHPTWRMGSKISVDSATMFNKGLELIEACWLFDLPPEKVEIVVHPESIVHSMVEFVDGSVIAQLSPPDMKTPIQYALTWPDRMEGIGKSVDFTKTQSLHFEPPDFEKFPALKLAYEVAHKGGSSGAVMNAANETAVSAFMAGNITLDGISDVVELTIRRHQVQTRPTLDDLLEADQWARATALSLIEGNLIRK
jgi:1-deoxy-D-xylulose-5-phosphate reductoisomerase